MSRRSYAVPALGLILGLAAGGAQGALYSVVAAPSDFGIGFTGQVDTTADTFTLLSVTDGSSGLDFWTISAPVVMNALDSAGAAYDVPDSWNGTIDSTWGFVGPLLSGVSYNEGSATATWSDWTTGWGAFINPIGDTITSQSHVNAMANWVYTAANSNGYWITQPGHGALTVTLVPAPGAAGALALGGLAAARRRR